jgi:hypothetical protein
VEFDLSALDDAWLGHSGLVIDVGNEYSLAQSYRDDAEANAKAAEAEADAKWRTKLKDDKPTEAVIRSKIALDSEVQRLQSAHREWKLLASLWGNLVKGFDSRQYALRSTSSLWQSGYWADNSSKAGRREAEGRIAAQVRSARNDE